MPKRPLVTAEDLEALERQGITGRQEQADAMNAHFKAMGRSDRITIHAIDKVRQRHELTKYERHRFTWAIPWSILNEDDLTTEVQYLRLLAAYVEGTRKSYEYVNQAARWLKGLYDKGLDLRYDPSLPKDERWITFPADRNNWHVAEVLQRVRSANRERRRAKQQ